MDTEATTSSPHLQSIVMDIMWKLGSRSTYASITVYEGVPKVHIRNHILLSDGTMKPTKKGVALNFDEWEAFKSVIESIDLAFRKVQSQQIETLPVLDQNMFNQGGAEAFPPVSTENVFSGIGEGGK